MKKKYLLIYFCCMFLGSLHAQDKFEQYFTDGCLRIDYSHSGDAENEQYAFERILKEPYWAGSHTKLIDTFEYGKYFFRVFDLKSDAEIYSRGFSSLFGEWQTTAEAKKMIKSFRESVVMPMPKADVRVAFYTRAFHTGEWEKKSEYIVNVDSYFIKENHHLDFPAFDVHISGKPSEKLDIVLIPEGYTHEEMGQFINDCKNFSEKLFTFAPYNDNEDRINIRGVWAPSEESGTDIPADKVYKNTIANSSFYTFDSERYLMIEDFQRLRDLAKNAPYDQIYVLVNTDKYGGGGIYNFYCTSINGNIKAPEVFIHEFGHGFAGLGDEYYTSSTSYEEFYDLKVEPWEPNITTLVSFDSKWKDLVESKTPIPTPATKKYKNKTGVFEGGGYLAKGIYRPAEDCLMKSFRGNVFCEACQRAIQQMIDFYAE